MTVVLVVPSVFCGAFNRSVALLLLLDFDLIRLSGRVPVKFLAVCRLLPPSETVSPCVVPETGLSAFLFARLLSSDTVGAACLVAGLLSAELVLVCDEVSAGSCCWRLTALEFLSRGVTFFG